MKINKLLLSILGLGMVMTSCNLDSDDEDNFQTWTMPCANLVIPDNGEVFAEDATYVLTFFYMSENLTVATSNLDLGTGKNYSFVTPYINYTTQVYNFNGAPAAVNSFKGGQANENNLTVRNINGYTTTLWNYISTQENPNKYPDYKWVSYTPLVMSYTVNSEYTVKTFLPDAIYTGKTIIPSPDGTDDNFVNDKIRYRVVFHDDYKKADIIFYNANFGHGMPVTIEFLLKNLDVAYNKNGYIISGNDLVPSLYQESVGWIENQGFPFKKFELINTSDDLTVATVFYTVSVMGKSYNCSFNGAYAFGNEQQ